MGRAEESFFLARDNYPAASRQASTGLSPKELKRAIEEDESFWTYRIWS